MPNDDATASAGRNSAILRCGRQLYVGHGEILPLSGVRVGYNHDVVIHAYHSVSTLYSSRSSRLKLMPGPQVRRQGFESRSQVFCPPYLLLHVDFRNRDSGDEKVIPTTHFNTLFLSLDVANASIGELKHLEGPAPPLGANTSNSMVRHV